MKKMLYKILSSFFTVVIFAAVLLSGIVASAENPVEIPNEYYIDYVEKINQVIYETFATDRLAFNEYMIYDIDNNGIKELLVKTGGSEADATITIYTYDGGVKELETISGWHSMLCETETGVGLYRYTFHMGYGSKSLITLENGAIKEETVFSDRDYTDQKYPEITEIPVYDFTGNFSDSIDYNGFTEKHDDQSFSGVWSRNGLWMLTKEGDLYLSGASDDAGSISWWNYTKDNIYMMGSWEIERNGITNPHESEYPVKRIFLLEEYMFSPYIKIFDTSIDTLTDVYVYDKNADLSFELYSDVKTDVVIHGYSHSTAQLFAEDNNIEFKAFDAESLKTETQADETEATSEHTNDKNASNINPSTGTTSSSLIYILIGILAFSVLAIIVLVVILILRTKKV